MTDWDGKTKPELVDACRERGLPVSGTVPQLTARLVDADTAGRSDSEVTPVASDGVPVGSPDPTGTPPSTPGVYKTAFPIPAGGFDDVFHERCRQATRDEALGAGCTVRAGAYRAGWGTDDTGNRTAVYEINIRRG